MPLFVLVLAALMGGAACRSAETPGATDAPRSLTTRFNYKSTIPVVPAHTKTLDVWLPVPSDSEWQTVTDLKVESPVSYALNRETQFGNRMVYLHLRNPQAPFTVGVAFVVHRKPIRVLAASERPEEKGMASLDRGRLLKSDKLVPVGGRYGKMARDVAGKQSTPKGKVHSIFEHVVATMQYDYKKESPQLGMGDVAFVCDYKKGNCSDLHSYMISLARSLKVPMVLEYGFPITGIPVPNPIPQTGTISGYHCWTWFQDTDGTWIPVDASDARRWVDAKQPEKKEYLFGNLVTERSAVAFSRGRDLTLNPPQQAGPVNYFIYPYAEADGQPVDAKWDLSYELLSRGD